ncbi:hypothetical protein P3655_22760 [Vibrio parahaemolyticus]|nr:hypothetical protein [Vibrio parahaemolyticus]
MNRGRVQAQGDNTEKSESWTTPDGFTKSMGLRKADALESLLTRPELSLRDQAISQARNRISTAPSYGINAVMKKSYYNDKRRRDIRVDIEVNAGTSFIDDPRGDSDGQ